MKKQFKLKLKDGKLKVFDEEGRCIDKADFTIKGLEKLFQKYN